MQLQESVSHSQVPNNIRPPFGELLVRDKFQDDFLNAKEFLRSAYPSFIGGASRSWNPNTHWVLGIH